MPDNPETLGNIKELEIGFRDLVDGILHQMRILRQENAELRAVLAEYRRQIILGAKDHVPDPVDPVSGTRVKRKFSVPYICETCHDPYENIQTHNRPRRFCDSCVTIRRVENARQTNTAKLQAPV